MDIRSAFLTLALALPCAAARAADWPQYRADAARSGSSSEKLPARLSLLWTYKPLHPPEPAWPDDPRMTFDRAFHVAVAGGTLYFGSSADCQVRALEAASGQQRWTFFTGAPVRFAPAFWKDRVFAASDDGYLYCLAAKDGRLLWKKRGGPGEGMILGNGRMVSKWPARGGPVVVGDRVYFAAGIWPADGVYLHALDAATGKEVWSNDKAGKMVREHPHNYGKPIPAGIGVQGHLAAAGNLLVVPTGRSTPAVYDRAAGKLKYFHPAKSVGGSGVMIFDSLIFNGRNAYSAADGKLAFGSGRKHVNTSWAPVAATKGLIFRAGLKGLEAIDRAKPFVKTGSGRKVKVAVNVKKTLRAPCSGEIIAAGGTVYCGGKGQVAAVDAGKLAATWTADVEGTVWGLAAAGGRLYVSTDAGRICCFGAGGGGRVVEQKPEASPYGSGGACAAAAQDILKKTGVRKGYCLDLGCGDGRLAYALARRSRLIVVGVEKNAAKVAEARKKLAAAGLYGVRVTIHQGDPAKTSYPRHFANLIVSGNSVTGGALPEKEAARLQRPWGGAVCAGRPGAMKPKVRGPLEGAGSWTHLYANAANTGASTDTLARGPLRMLWFGGPRLNVPNRHGRPPSPLFYEGRMFAMGVDAIRALDAYNGHLIWEFPLGGVGKPYHNETLLGVAGAGSNYCVAPEGLFVRTAGKCLRIDAATGKKLGGFRAPEHPDGKPVRWGYLACSGGTLYGTVTNDEHLVKRVYRTVPKMLRTESVSLFAMEAKTGKVKWSYKARKSIRHNAVAVGGGRVYLIDRPIAAHDHVRSKEKKGPHPGGELVALEAGSGRELWRKGEDIWGTVLSFSPERGVLLMSYQAGGYNLRSETGGKLAAFQASTGKRLWEIEARYRSRPIIIGGTVHAEPYAYELATGKKTGFNYRRGHGCGTVSGSPHLLLFRSGPLGFVDLDSGKVGKKAVEFYGGTRPGCWVNAIPAGGLVLLPNSYNNCSCSYLNRTNVALQPKEEARK